MPKSFPRRRAYKPIPGRLTARRLRALAAIAAHLHLHHTPPTFRELAAALGLTTPGAAKHYITQLHRGGLLHYTRSRTGKKISRRTLRLTPQGERVLARYQHLDQSGLQRGQLQLVLTPPALAVAQKLDLPLDHLATHRQGDQLIVTFPTRAERDAWAARIHHHLTHPP